MRALRITLHQHKANYRKPEGYLHKTTYPLPPFSTVIGAVHTACGYRTYHPMQISVAGSFGTMGREVYQDHAFLNSLQNDRGILVKFANPKLQSLGFTKVAVAKNAQGNDFYKEITIEVLNRTLLDEYKQLRDSKNRLADYKKTEIDPKVKGYKDEEKRMKAALKGLDKKGEEFAKLDKELKAVVEERKSVELDYDYQNKEIADAYANFGTLTTSIKSYEVLYDVSLVLHFHSDDETMMDIYNNIHNLRAIGRSEDFVDSVECDFVELSTEIDDLPSYNSAYVKYSNVKEDYIFLRGEVAQGTKYFMNKDYEIVDNKRCFNREWVVYASRYNVISDEENQNTGLYLDQVDDTHYHIVNFI